MNAQYLINNKYINSTVASTISTCISTSLQTPFCIMVTKSQSNRNSNCCSIIKNLYKEDGELFQSISSGDSLKKEILVSFRYELNQCLEKIQNNEASFTDLSNLIGQLQNKSNLEYKILNKAQDRMTDWLKNIFGANLIQTSSEKALVRMCQDALKIGKGIVSQNQNRQTLP